MKILFDSARRVNPARAFGAGIRPARLPDRPFEPSPEDRRWWAAECGRLERGHIRDDHRVTDLDVIVATGCCG
jgi:hypothetical protein